NYYCGSYAGSDTFLF
nr:immunoglobulin light chain junction region [Macaca mulatta]MOV73060.1 immunoglobulin light chain junction region [Macaca mulatta]